MQDKAKTKAKTAATAPADSQQAPKAPSAKKSSSSLLRNGLVVVALGLIATSLFLEEPSSTPDDETIQAIKASFKTEGSAAREQIAQMQEVGNVDAVETAYQQGQVFESDGERVDAYLMYFFAARKGHAESALKLAEMSDPLANRPEKAEPYQAYKWYKTAADSGIEEASEQLEKLKQWAETSAGEGNPAAQRLLLQWPS